MELKKTPDRLFENGEAVEYGAFKTPFEELNFSDARIRVGGMKLPRLYSRFRFKEWQHFGVTGDDFYFGLAVVDTKYLGNSFCYFLDRTNGNKVEHDRLAPPGVARVAHDTKHGECRFEFRGYRIEIENRLEDGYHRAEVDIEGSAEKPGVTARLEIIEDLEKTQPLILFHPLRGERPGYTHKVACPAKGEITVGGKTFSFDEESGMALIDETRAFFPYRTAWKWATCAGHDERGRLVALNLSQGDINLEVEKCHDNVLWVDGKLHFLGLPRFEFDENDVLQPWRIESDSGDCQLDFRPAGERWGNINFGVLMSNFHQPYGTFSGTAVDSEGITHRIDNYFGVTEHHLARF